MPPYYAILDQRSNLLVSGPDTRSFLQGQATCDLDRLTPAQAISGALCTPQGRMYADFSLLQIGDDAVLIGLDASIAESTQAALGRYIVFSKAELSVAGDWQTLGLWGDGLAQQLPFPAPGRDGVVVHAGAHWRQCDDAGQRFELSVVRKRFAELAGALPDGCQQTDEEHYRVQEIRAGLAHVTAATSGELLPQLLNYPQLDRVSFSKGCYTGQEVVARMHYKGKPKRILRRAELPGQSAPAPGTEVVATDSGQVAGLVVTSADGADGAEMLLVVNRKAGDGLRLAGGEAALQPRPLPYDSD